MDVKRQQELIQKIVNPDPRNADELLENLGLAGIPSRDVIHQEIEQKLLLPQDKLPDHWLPSYQVHWEHKISIPSLLQYEPSPPPTSISFVRAGIEGKVTGYVETVNPKTSSGLTSTSFDRAPAPSKSFVRGKSGFVPFWPGGLEDPILAGDSSELNNDTKGLRTIAPGLSRGLKLPGEVIEDEEILGLENIHGEYEGGQETDESAKIDEQPVQPLTGQSTEIDDLLPTNVSHLKPTRAPTRLKRVNIQKRDWAHVIDVKTPLHNFHELVPDMAHKYPFELDTFQKHAVYHLELGESVFVAAHTSAGKTVVAEYAIALAEKHMTRAIYTSPIKALSNQKFRDFKQTFSSSSVGILTGDVQINPEASCLIMTTEILRSMLYKGADLIRDVEFVIFDEVHYVNDAERGVVWEEVIIMLPDHVSIILLSATIPNTKEFADWVGRTKKKDIYVISTAQRPVPLEHYLYAGRETHKIVDAQRNFIGPGYKDAGEALRRKQDKEREAAGLPPVQRLGARAAANAAQRGQRGGSGRGSAPPNRGRGGGGGGGGSARSHHTIDKNLYVHLLGHLKKKALLPVVVFTLSKKRCEENASTLTNADLCTSVEKSEVHVAIEKALSRLKGSDKKLPQIARMRDLLTRGIGVHHGGLLPLVKELVEILFARGLVKILFATETFAMGVNMPAKCVVFSGIRKHDGRSFRDILPGEYTQMAGRAGRRGLDPTGTVIIVANDSLPEQTTLHTMILGVPGKLQSQFRLTYNMILNLLRVEALRVEEMIKRSFSENAAQRLLPDQQKKVVESEKALSTLQALECEVCTQDINLFYDDSLEIVNLNQSLFEMAASHPQGVKSFTAGRVVILRDGHFKTNTAAILLKQAPLQATEDGRLTKVKTFYMLALVDPETKAGRNDIDPDAIPPRWPPTPKSLLVDDAIYELRAVSLASIVMVTSRSLKVEVDNIVDRHLISRMREGINGLQGLIEEWINDQSIPENDWGRMRSLDFQELLRSRAALEERLKQRTCVQCSNFDEHYRVIHGRKVLEANIANLKLALSDQNLELMPDYEQRIEVLRELKFIDENSTVLLKGRVACEINSANELILTELILENTLGAYEPEEIVALLSCFVFQEKSDAEPEIPPQLKAGKDAILAISDRIGRVQDLHKVATEEFRSSLKFGLLEVVYEWAKGMPFEQITELTEVAEGTIVRTITRLDETCREVRDAARVIGDAELFKKMEECQVKIKRDIISIRAETALSHPTFVMTAKPDQYPHEIQSSQTDDLFASPGPSSPCTHSSPSSRKRKFEAMLADDDSFSQEFPDTYHKTRRVNPQRLAVRLGPDLVSEMEAHIFPGAKMPTFDVRKVLQEKYNVDRRHIYDYFHSRGLRVAKEDKHTNLTRGRIAKALQKQTEEVAPQNEDKLPDCLRISLPTLKPSTKEPSMTEKIHATSLLENSVKGIPTKPVVQKKRKSTLSKVPAPRSQCNTVPKFKDLPLSGFSLFTLETQCRKSPLPHEELAEEILLPSLSPVLSATPVFSPDAQEHPVTLSDPALGDLNLDISSVSDFQSDFGIDLPFHYLDPDSLVTIVENRPLTASERMEMYNMIHNNIGPPEGIEESKGTYHKYMEERSKRQFSRLSLGGKPSELSHPSQISVYNPTSRPYNLFDSVGLGINLGKPVPVSQLISSQEIFKDSNAHDFSELIDFPPEVNLDTNASHSTRPTTADCFHCSTPRSASASSQEIHLSTQCDIQYQSEKTPVNLPQNNFRSFMFNTRLRAGSAGGGI